MSIFKKIFKGGEASQAPASESDPQSFRDLLERHGAYAFEKQLLFGAVIGDRPWQFDMQASLITFGDDLKFGIQIIGSVSFNDSSFLWGWANDKSGIPEKLLLSAQQLKSMGKLLNIEEFTEPHFSVSEGFEHQMGMVACGVSNAKSYYSANYGQGTLVLVIKVGDVPQPDHDNLSKVLFAFPQFIASQDVDHRRAFQHYLAQREAQVEKKGNQLIASLGTQRIIAEFDNLGRLTNLKGENLPAN